MDEPTHDVVIIGSGAGGAAAAWMLTARGLRVLLLEAGPAYDPATDYRLHLAGWEQRFPHKVQPAGRQTFAPLQPLSPRWEELRSWNTVSGRYNRTWRRQPWRYSHVVGLGGSTLHFTGEAQRINPASMKMRSRFGVAADWPVDYAELEPWYVMAERVIGVAGPTGDAVRWRSAPFPLAAHPLSYGSQQIAAGARDLGLSWVPNARAALSRLYDGRPPCNYCGNCTRGCPLTDKGSMDVTLIRKARATGRLTIRTQASVTRIEAAADDRVGAVQFIDAWGRTRSIKASAVVVACGAVETPRLLLNSANRYAPDGLANDSGEVGHNFMETMHWMSAGLHPEPLGSHRGLPSDSICWDYNAPDAIPGIIGGCRFTNATAESGFNGPVAYAKRAVKGWGAAHKREMRQSFGRILAISGIGENLPNARSFIDLDPRAKDSHGLPKARIHSHLDKWEVKRLAFMAKTAREILKAAGTATLVEEYGVYDGFNATHVFGTCRMGSKPRNSVVDAFCRSHRWRNLFVMDASVFPSSGGGEGPFLTIVALALRAAEHLSKAARRGDL